MNKKYIDIGELDDKVIEECSEVIKAICKIKRFGLLNHHPNFPDKNNLTDVLDEISDLRYALNRYEEDLLKDRLVEMKDKNGRD
jgi:phosphoribosyl-ATP pyrophosphohydrolase